MALTVENLLEAGSLYAESILRPSPLGEEGDYETRETGIGTIYQSYNDRDDAATTILVSDGGDAESILRQILAGLARGSVAWEDAETGTRVTPKDLAAHIEQALDKEADEAWMGFDVDARFLWYYYENNAYMPGHTSRELLDLRDDTVLDVNFGDEDSSGVKMTDQGLELQCAVRIAQRWVLEDRETDAPDDFCVAMQDVLGVHQDFYPATLVVDLSTGCIRQFTLSD